ncbi:MAG: insulinase family protein [Hyphomonadaceae bacterium]|nr:insulinase family protein [Hyphomonadaceae bacterium]
MTRALTGFTALAGAVLFLAACVTSAPVEEADLVVEEAEVEVLAPVLDVTVHEGDFARIEQFTTPGGISVWLVNEPSIPIVSFQAAWPGGSASDPAGLEGLNTAMIYQMNEGAGALPALEFQKAMESLNMSFGCSSARDWTSCSASMLRENADEAMALVALAMSEPRFDEGPFERFKRESEVSLAQRETNPRFLANEAMEAALYPDHAYAREMTAESLAAITRDMLAAQKDAIMVKDGMLVTAVGAISPEDFAPLIDAALTGLPAMGLHDVPGPLELGAPVADPIVRDLPQPQSLISFSAPGLQRDHPDFFTAYVLNYTFGGGGFESRLMEELRVERGLTYGIGTWLSYGGELAAWSGRSQTKNESAGEFLTVLKGLMSEIAETGITEQELADAKSYLTGAYPLAFDSNSAIAGNMMDVRQDGLSVDYFDRRNALVNAVTLEDVNRVAGEYLKPENFTFVVVGEPEGLE